MSLIEEVAKLLAELPPLVVEEIHALVKGASESDDPLRYVQRRAAADAAHLAAQDAARAALGDPKE